MILLYYFQVMLLHGILSFSLVPPARWKGQNQLEENVFLCFWSEALPYAFGAQVKAISTGSMQVGQTKKAVLSVSAGANVPVQVGESIVIGTAFREQVGQFSIEAIEEHTQDLPMLPHPLPISERDSLTQAEQQLFICIEKWIQQADRLCNTLRDAYQLDFSRIGQMERNTCMGRKGKIEGLIYFFHGIGCYFETKDLKIDIDFDSRGDWQGFDEWRIESFISWNYPHLHFSSKDIEQGILALLNKKWLYQIDRMYDHNFYYVVPTA
ncbi:DUF6896 domain-containing protein [Hymenobacter defluvii]|uniref:DUF6896 domain-containing protein n=1 Tax=Hymenobacter defluvii TaxID=2054411 RepID=A0ABS3TB32_9BACT|nr:hypothetical protein [Hymenobacter defluvii]MBO3270860.1 hypothetical protein [Hymenobacter defluvii]